MFGLQCYLTDCEGFKGKIKQSWEDFEVTEINENGELVKLTTSEVPPDVSLGMACDSKTCCVSALDEVAEECNSRSSDKTVEKKLSGPFNCAITTDETASPDTELERVLGSSKLHELCVLADSKCEEGNHTMRQVLTLGGFESKHERVTVHVNVRRKFPFLKTFSKNTRKEGSQTIEICATFDAVYQEFLTLMKDKEDVNSLFQFVHCVKKENGQIHNLKSDDDRNHRTLVHRLIAKHFGSFLESKTFNEENQGVTTSFIQVRMRFKPTKASRRQDKQRSVGKSSKKDFYTGFVLQKKNTETLEAIQLLAKCLNTHASAFSYAGIKDKKAVTQQYMVVRGVTPEQLAGIQGNSILKGIKTGNYVRNVPSPLKLGQLRGNKFRIVIRDVQHRTNSRNLTLWKKVEKAVVSLSNSGFVNYYGHQRFGLESNSVNSHNIGLAILQGDMVRAVKLLLSPSGRQPEDPTDAAKRYFLETGDIPGTLSRMPDYKSRECLILKSLRRHGSSSEGCTKAFMNIPFSMRLLYVHSYCSLVWNHVASHRLKMNGSRGVVEGDLVCDSGYSEATTEQADDFRCEEDAEQPTAQRPSNVAAVLTVLTRSGFTATPSFLEQRPAGEYSRDANTTEPIFDENTSLGTSAAVNEQREDLVRGGGVCKSHVRIVNSRDVEAGRYSLRDVVLPMVGHSTVYPGNEAGESLKERLAADGLTSDSFRVRSLGLNVPGAYRKLIGYPKKLEWRWVDSESLRQVSSDSVSRTEQDDRSSASLEPRCKRLKPDEGETATGETGDSVTEQRTESHRALEVSFCLDPSCYATVLLRELMKT